MSRFKIKPNLVLTLVFMVCSCVLTVPTAAGQAISPADQAVIDKATADKARADTKAAAEKAAAEKGTLEKAEAEKAEAERVAKIPLLVAGIVPFVESDEKGEIGNPNKLGSAGMGDRISVAVPGLSLAAKYKVVDPMKLALFVDG